jgi:predicted SAM-dependent methyltransferase
MARGVTSSSRYPDRRYLVCVNAFICGLALPFKSSRFGVICRRGMSSRQYVQYGCGLSAPSGWRNFDSSPTLRLERLPLIGRLCKENALFPQNVEYGDIVKGLPVSPDTCTGVYCSHVLEHLSLDDFRTALSNTYKILERGRIFRLVLPDLLYLAKQYLDNKDNDAALVFMRQTGLGQEKRARTPKELIGLWLGTTHHRWLWDYKSIKPELEAAGFVEVRSAVFGDSADKRFWEVEEKDRWNNCLGLECRKPR